MNSPSQSSLSLSVSDKFGDSGLTGVALVEYNGDRGKINDFLMSCRIMGRNLEYVFMDYIVVFLKQQGCNTIEACYRPTQKNKPVSDFYDRCGFLMVSEHNGKKAYILNANEYNYQNISYIKIR